MAAYSRSLRRGGGGLAWVSRISTMSVGKGGGHPIALAAKEGTLIPPMREKVRKLCYWSAMEFRDCVL